MRPLCAAIAMALLFAPGTAVVNAQTRTWDGGGTTNNWSNENNWNGNTDIANNSSLIFAGSTRLNAVNNLPNPDNPLGGITTLSVNGLSFAAGAGAFTLSGNPFTSNGNITNLSSNLQVLNTPVIVGATQTWDGGSAGMTFSKMMSFPSFSTLSLANSVTVREVNASLTLIGTRVLNIASRSRVESGEGEIGEGARVNINGTGSTWAVSRDFTTRPFYDYNPEGSSPVFSIANGGKLTSTNGYLNSISIDNQWNPPRASSALVTGAGSVWENSGNLFAYSGAARSNILESTVPSLTIEGGGRVTNIDGFVGSLDPISFSLLEARIRVTGTGSTWSNSGQLFVGHTSRGHLDISSAGQVTSTNGTIGTVRTGYGVVSITGAGSIWANSALLEIGNAGGGYLTISDGGKVTSTNGTVGAVGGGYGVVTVTGAGSIWANSALLEIGKAGYGNLNIADGGKVTSTNGTVGVVDGYSNVVSITGAGSIWANSALLEIGKAGTGNLTITDGGKVTSRDGTVGAAAGGSGVVTITGAGSIWANSGFVKIGDAGAGTLTISDGGSVTAGGGSGIANAVNGVGALNVGGAGSTFTTSSLDLGYSGSGTLSITDGGTVQSTFSSIGLQLGSIGTATVRGNNSIWTNSNELFVGDSVGRGTLNVESGGKVTNSGGFVARSAGSTGLVNVNGAGSIWASSADLQVGVAGNGALNISNGGAVTNADGFIGTNAGSTGVVSVTGAGSTWNSSGQLFVGNEGAGTLAVSDGGVVSSLNGYLGAVTGGTGLVTVTGVGATWTNTSELKVGDLGAGTLNISAGGSVTSAFGYIGGSYTAATGLVTVTGANSKWTNAYQILVGSNGQGTLTIANGGTVVGGADVSSNIGGGEVIIGARGTLNLSGAILHAGSLYKSAGGQFNWTGGTLRLMDAFTLGSSVLDSVFVLSSARTLEAGSSFAVGAGNQLYLAGGTLGGAGSLVNDAFLSGFGTIVGSGGFTNSALLSQSGGNLVLSNTGPNANNGNWDLPSGFQLQLAGATLTNNASLNLNSGQVTGTGTLINAAGGSIFGRGVIATNFENAGVLALDAGTTSITRAFANSGQIQLASKSALLAGGVVTNSGRIEGFGKVNNAVNNSGMVEAIGGTLTMAGSLTNASGGIIAAGSGAKVLLSSGLASNAGQIQLAGGTFDNNGRTLTNAASGVVSGYGTVRSGAIANDGRVLLAGGTSAVYAAVTANAGSQIVLSGNSNTTFYGAVEIKGPSASLAGAELRVSQGSVATFFGQVNQRTGALFTGTGAKNYEAGFAVGNSPGLGTDPGNVTFGAANIYEAEIGGTNPGDLLGAGIQFDRYVVGGALTFGGTLKVVQFGGYAPQAGNSFDLFDWGTRAGQFAALDFSAAPLVGGLAWDTSNLYVDGTLSVAAVPEPGSYAMMLAGLGLMGFMVSRRRQRQPV